VATYKTLPDRPDPPAKPRIKGHIQATQCRIAWGKNEFEFFFENKKTMNF
jgi:hypothetical protein